MNVCIKKIHRRDMNRGWGIFCLLDDGQMQLLASHPEYKLARYDFGYWKERSYRGVYNVAWIVGGFYWDRDAYGLGWV